MKRRNYRKILITGAALLVVSAIMIMGINSASAKEYANYPEGWQLIPQCAIDDLGVEEPCDLDDFVQMFVNAAGIGLKILPYIAMVMMIWAGFNLIMAGGNTEKIQEGKKMITSIVLGIIIVTVLAWSWSLFVVYVLTGGVEIFPNTPLHRAWWGGGVADDLPPDYGCCYVEGYGCEEMQENECVVGMRLNWELVGAVAPNISFLGSATLCSEHAATCDNFNYGCCVPTDETNKLCYKPQTNGCINYKFTTHAPNDCNTLTDSNGEKRCDDVVSGENLPPDLRDGCCVTANSCETKSYSDCAGDFYASQNCSEFDECKAGCCVGANSCSSGKINCQGTYDPADCTGLAECTIGCCITEASTNYPTCYENTTAGECTSKNPTDNSLNAVGCNAIPACTLGCCYSPCGNGNIDSCSNAEFNYEVDCANSNRCDVGFCISSGAVSCASNIERQNCSAAGDQFINNPALCTTGCCMDPSQSYRCIDGYAAGSCGVTFYAGVCSLYTSIVGHNCQSGGICNAGGTCIDMTPSQTRAWCQNQPFFTSYQPPPATCP